MKKFRKLLAGILTLAMLVTMMPATVMAATTVTSQEKLNAAVKAANDGDTITIAAGTYTLPEFSGKELTFVGAENEEVAIYDYVTKGSQGMTGSTVHFENLTINGATENYYGLYHTTKVTYEDCTINGLRFLFAPEVIFTNCDFYANGVEHSFWTYGSQNITVTDCTFNYSDRAVNCYAEDGKYTTSTNFTNCEFIYTGDKSEPEGAVEINSGLIPGKDAEIWQKLSFTNCTAPAKGAMWFNSQWDAEEGAYTTVNVDGKQVWPLVVAEIDNEGFTTLAEAVEAAKDGDTITMLADVELDSKVTIEAGQNITLDLNGYTISGECNASQSHMFMVENTATLNIKDTSDGKDGKITFASGSSNVGWVIDVEGNLNLYSGTIELTGSWSIGYAVDVRPNSWGTEYTEGTVFHMYDGKLISSDGAIRVASSSSDGAPNDKGGYYPLHENVSATFIMDGGSIEAAWDGIFVQQSNVAYDILNVEIKDGTISSALAPIRFYAPTATSVVNDVAKPMNVSITGGAFKYTGEKITDTEKWIVPGLFKFGGGAAAADILDKAEVKVSGGHFTANPSDYVTEGKAVTASTKAGYSYMVVNASEVKVEVDTAVSAGTPDVTVPTGIAGVTEETVAAAVSSAETANTLGAVASDLANDASVITETVVDTAVEKLGETSSDNITIVVEPYLEVEVTEVKTTGDTVEMTLNITPMYNLVATTADHPDQMNDTNSVTVKTGAPLEVEKGEVITIVVPVPEAFKGEGSNFPDTLQVLHKKDNGKRYMYEATVEGGKATFDNPNGFSTFVLTSALPVATITDNGTTVGFLTLAEAIDEVKDGQTIVLQDNCDEDVAVSGDAVFTLDTNGKTFSGEIVAGANTTMVVTESGSGVYEYVFEYTAPSSSSKGGSTSKSYTADVADADNGSIRLSREKAKPGTEVTITVTPDKGYKLDELKVLNSRGTEIAVTDNGDGTFTFKMPKGGVEIEASFVEGEAEVTPAVPSTKEETTLVLTIGQTIYQLDGNYAANDVAPIIKADRTFLPIRLVAETLGATVTWSEADQSVTIVKGDTTIVIYIDQAFALVNGEPVELDAPAFIANDRTYLPVRFIAENLGATVTWDAETQTVTVIG